MWFCPKEVLARVCYSSVDMYVCRCSLKCLLWSWFLLPDIQPSVYLTLQGVFTPTTGGMASPSIDPRDEHTQANLCSIVSGFMLPWYARIRCDRFHNVSVQPQHHPRSPRLAYKSATGLKNSDRFVCVFLGVKNNYQVLHFVADLHGDIFFQFLLRLKKETKANLFIRTEIGRNLCIME